MGRSPCLDFPGAHAPTGARRVNRFAPIAVAVAGCPGRRNAQQSVARQTDGSGVPQGQARLSLRRRGLDLISEGHHHGNVGKLGGQP